MAILENKLLMFKKKCPRASILLPMGRENISLKKSIVERK
jgi:hypothetical protein